MAEISSIEIGKTPEENESTMFCSWTFRCSNCNSTRKAFMFCSGHVIDLAPDQKPELQNLIKIQREEVTFFQNLYFIPEVMDASLIETQEGIMVIKTLIARSHAIMFHDIKDLDGVKMIGKN